MLQLLWGFTPSPSDHVDEASQSLGSQAGYHLLVAYATTWFEAPALFE